MASRLDKLGGHQFFCSQRKQLKQMTSEFFKNASKITELSLGFKCGGADINRLSISNSVLKPQIPGMVKLLTTTLNSDRKSNWLLQMMNEIFSAHTINNSVVPEPGGPNKWRQII